MAIEPIEIERSIRRPRRLPLFITRMNRRLSRQKNPIDLLLGSFEGMSHICYKPLPDSVIRTLNEDRSTVIYPQNFYEDYLGHALHSRYIGQGSPMDMQGIALTNNAEYAARPLKHSNDHGLVAISIENLLPESYHMSIWRPEGPMSGFASDRYSGLDQIIERLKHERAGAIVQISNGQQYGAFAKVPEWRNDQFLYLHYLPIQSKDIVMKVSFA